jgi:hypothetical protein
MAFVSEPPTWLVLRSAELELGNEPASAEEVGEERGDGGSSGPSSKGTHGPSGGSYSRL